MRNDIVNRLFSYVEALYPIIYISYADTLAVDKAIEKISDGAKCVEYNNALGLINFKNKSPMKDCDLEQFLRLVMDDGFEQKTFIILRDVHEELRNPKIMALLKRIAEYNLYKDSYNATIFIISEIINIPLELENYITLFDIPLPNKEDIVAIIEEFADNLDMDMEKKQIENIALSLKGLSEFQIRQILNLAYQNDGTLDENDKDLILKSKEQIIKKSSMLEIVALKENMDDIGGLDNLKSWLENKAEVFLNLDKAIKFGVDIPKGVMIIGMPGCGKSLTAKVTASLFKVPLIRLDIGQILGKYVGESEGNMRKALKLAEATSPCVLWIDEIEKAFAGVGGEGGGNDVTTRLFGQFLTWMQEKESTVFIVATANDTSKMPPEFLRKGRFDELFFVDLPNENERKTIIDIHLKKRNKMNSQINISELVKSTAGFNGADIEGAIKDTIEKAFVNNEASITTQELKKVFSNTKSISDILKDRLEEIRKTVSKIGFKKASKS